MSDIRTHRVASTAYQCVDGRRNDENRKQYGALAHKLPGMILQNGLAQATGFLLAKGKPEHLALLEDLNRVLRSSGEPGADDGPALHQAIITTNLQQHQQLTRRALDASGWIKRYVQGVLKISATGDSTEQNDTDQALETPQP